MAQKIKLGDKVEDMVSGLIGIVISEIKYLSECHQLGVKPKVGEDGKMPEVHYIDIAQIKRLGPGVKIPVETKPKESRRGPGGLQADAPKE